MADRQSRTPEASDHGGSDANRDRGSDANRDRGSDANRDSGSDANRALILDFANTLDVEASTDDLVTRAQLADFLQRAGVVDGRGAASEQDVALARELRSGIRAAMHLNHDEVRGDVPELSRVLTRLPMRLGWTAGARASSRSRLACPAAWRRSR